VHATEVGFDVVAISVIICLEVLIMLFGSMIQLKARGSMAHMDAYGLHREAFSGGLVANLHANRKLSLS